MDAHKAWASSRSAQARTASGDRNAWIGYGISVWNSSWEVDADGSSALGYCSDFHILKMDNNG
jgi:hypothetical protein